MEWVTAASSRAYRRRPCRPVKPGRGRRGGRRTLARMPEAGVGITRDEVAHLARLARLAVTEEELDVFAGQLDVILGAVARVQEVATADIPPTSHSVPLTNVLRPDVVAPCLDRDEVLAAAPAAEDGRFRVPRILDEE